MTQAAETPLPFEYAGRVVGFRNVEVRPRVGGLLLTREYVEGAKVREGDVLFRIDPATYEVALSRAEAQRQQAQATLRQAEENFKRIEQLSSKAIATERQLDDAVAQRDQARASVQLAEAEIRNARLNLDYTTVVAPASGVTALQSPPVGTLIQAQQTLLTTITRLDPAYVMFSFTDTEAQDSASSTSGAQNRSWRKISRSSCTTATAPSTRTPARSTRRPSAWTCKLGPSRPALFFRTLTAL